MGNHAESSELPFSRVLATTPSTGGHSGLNRLLLLPFVAWSPASTQTYDERQEHPLMDESHSHVRITTPAASLLAGAGLTLRLPSHCRQYPIPTIVFAQGYCQ